MTLSPALVDKYNRAAFIDIDDVIYRVTVFDDDEAVMYVEHEDSGEQHTLDLEELATVNRFYEIVEIKDEDDDDTVSSFFHSQEYKDWAERKGY